jgi:hypothetical protein
MNKRFRVYNLKSKVDSFTLIEVLVGTFLILIVFLGIFGAYQLGFKVIGLSKNKITATAILNGEIEKIRNLPYESVGVSGEFPNGILEKISYVTQNNIQYQIERRVDFVVDPADGIASPDDDCPNDYKRAEIKVSWSGVLAGQISASTDIAPKNLAQECGTAGGILSVSVFDAQGIMVPSPLIEIKDPITDQTLKTATPLEGKHYFSLPADTYKIVVSKTNYSSERTYGTEEITTPENPHPIVLNGQLTETSFSIDKLSSFSVDTLSPWGQDFFSDSFLDSSKISESENINISEGKVTLAKTGDQYQSPGYLISISISPQNLINWDKFSFSDFEPAGTQILYQILYFNGTDWNLIPDTDLPGNSLGFAVSPVDLSSLNPSTYSQLKIKGNLSTTDPNISPEIYHWQVSWINSQATPIQNVTFNLRGEKIIGKDQNENPVYKYSQNQTSNSSGHIDISNLEWDNYHFSVDPATGLDLVSTDPSPQPIGLAPNTNLAVKLYLDSQNSLLVTIKNSETLEPVFSASVRLSKTGYDQTQYTNEKGQTYFIPLEIGDYSLEVQAAGYSPVSDSVSISGDMTKTINLTQIE